MTLLLLIRHGHTQTAGRILTGWSRGVHLSERGREQAERLVGRLQGVPLAAIYSSPLERCRETAAPLAAARGLEIRTHRGLIETGYGEWTGRSISQVTRTKLWRTLQRSPSAVRFPGGESLRDVQARSVDAILRIAADHPQATVGVATHADVVQLVLAHLAGVHLDLFQRLVAEPASISAVGVHDGVYRIVKVNDTGDLSDLAPRRRSGRTRPPEVGG
jgi:probable phosphomutase (TIGR03848 family)